VPRLSRPFHLRRPPHLACVLAFPRFYDRLGRGGGHTPFNQARFAAVHITESNENYGRPHSTADTFASAPMPE
jgi:hypothetical protein